MLRPSFHARLDGRGDTFTLAEHHEMTIALGILFVTPHRLCYLHWALTDGTVARTVFTPFIEAGSTHTWTVVMTVVMTIDKAVKDIETRNKIALSEISKTMVSHRFCERGWEITYRDENSARLSFMGWCR